MVIAAVSPQPLPFDYRQAALQRLAEQASTFDHTLDVAALREGSHGSTTSAFYAEWFVFMAM